MANKMMTNPALYYTAKFYIVYDAEFSQEIF